MKLLFLTVLAISATALSSCNTMIGLGRDTRLLGEGMEKTAEKSAPGGGSSDIGGDVSGAPVY